MSLVSQRVRSNPSPSNPTGIVDDLLKIGTTSAASGVPDSNTSGLPGSSYIDSSTGIQYIKQSDGSWQPIYDPGTLPVNDPFIAGTVECNFLKVDESSVDAIVGRTSESVSIDLKAGGDLNISSGPVNGININAGNTVLTGNGGITAQSGVRSYETIVDNFSGRQIKLEQTPEYKLAVTGLAGDLTIDAGANTVKLASDLDMQSNNILNFVAPPVSVITGNPDLTINGTALTLDPSGFINLGSTVNVGLNDFVNCDLVQGPTLNMTSTVNTINKTSGIHSFTNVLNDDIVTIEGNTGNGKMTVSGLPFGNGNKIEIDGIGSIKKIGTSALNIEQTNAGSNTNLLSNGGVIRMQDGANAMTFDPAAKRATMEKIVIEQLNFSAGKTIYTSFGTDETGVLDFRKPPKTFDVAFGNMGSNGSIYATNIANPADFTTYYLGSTSRNLIEVNVRLAFSAAWSFGGGTSTLGIGYCLQDTPAIDANYVSMYTMALNTAGNFYQQESGSINVAIPANASLVVKITNTGTSSTSNNAELFVNFTVH